MTNSRILFHIIDLLINGLALYLVIRASIKGVESECAFDRGLVYNALLLITTTVIIALLAGL